MVFYGSLMGVGALIQWVMLVRLRSASFGRLIRWVGLPLVGMSIAAQLGLFSFDAASGAAAGAVFDDVLSPIALGCWIAGFLVRSPVDAQTSNY